MIDELNSYEGRLFFYVNIKAKSCDEALERLGELEKVMCASVPEEVRFCEHEEEPAWSDDDVTCPECDGSMIDTTFMGPPEEAPDCPHCDGMGLVPYDFEEHGPKES